jgi:Uma2 family endonuclease
MVEIEGMSVATLPTSNSISDIGPLFRLSVAQYHELADAGILEDGDPVELIEGLLVQRMTKNPPHSSTVLRLQSLLPPLLPPDWHYRSQQPITLSDGEPEPDGVIAARSISDYSNRHPTAADVALVIEVADATLARDRGIKLRSYARAGIPQYWIVNLIDRQIEAYSDPDPAAAPEPTYRRREMHAEDLTLPLTICGAMLASLLAADFLPPQAMG